jgi:hypothetical protein
MQAGGIALVIKYLLGYLQVVGGVVYPTNLRKNAKYTIHVVDNSQYHMNTLTIIQYPTISNI